MLYDKLDDIYPLFKDDEAVSNYLYNFREALLGIKLKIVHKSEKFYNENKNLIRKDYAIKVQNEEKDIMSLLMDMYLNRFNDNSINEFIMKRELYKNIKSGIIDYMIENNHGE